MTLIRTGILALTLLALPAQADPPRASPALGLPMTAAEFDAYATGKTLTYGQSGAVWGVEQYMPGRQVLWAMGDEPCEFGQWFEDDSAICFIYEGKSDLSCWYFFLGSTGLIARFVGGDSLLSEVDQTDEPMNCPGPKIGA